MIIFSKTKGEGITPSEFVKREPVIRVGHCYPNLYTQAVMICEREAKTKDKMLKKVADLKLSGGYDIINQLMDAAYDYAARELEFQEDCNESLSKDAALDITNGIFQRLETAKSVLELFRLCDHLTELNDEIELTKQNISL